MTIVLNTPLGKKTGGETFTPLLKCRIGDVHMTYVNGSLRLCYTPFNHCMMHLFRSDMEVSRFSSFFQHFISSTLPLPI